MNRNQRPLTSRQLRALEKGQIHEHIDCSPDPLFMLKRQYERGFDKVKPKLPSTVVKNWRDAQALRTGTKSEQNLELAAELERKAARTYQRWLARFASKSLANYVQAIRDHILPLMQTSTDLYEVTRKRIADAVEDGHIFLELRFAPQLHTMEGLTLDQVMAAVNKAVNQAPIPVRLIVCALRHENDKQFVPHNPVHELAALTLKYEEVGVFDLAADEGAYPGVLDWFMPAAVQVQEGGKLVDCHLWEVNDDTSQDRRRLAALYPFLSGLERRRLSSLMKKVAARCAAFSQAKTAEQRLALLDQIDGLLDQAEALIHKSGRVGHGIRGKSQGTYVLEVCPTSNVVTGQVKSFDQHPIGELLRAGKLVTINTDGTLFTQIDLTKEYDKLQKQHKFTLAEFYVCNRIALAASSFSPAVKASIKAKLAAGYRKQLSSKR
jgi:adenosine deaminase